MPRPRKSSNVKIQTYLGPIDQQRFDQVVASQKRPAAEVARVAIRHYLDYCDSLPAERQESKIERRLKRLEDRMAGLLARLGIDVGIIYQFLWIQSNPETRAELFNKCFKASKDRLAGKLDVIEDEFKELLKDKVLREEKTQGGAPE